MPPFLSHPCLSFVLLLSATYPLFQSSRLPLHFSAHLPTSPQGIHSRRSATLSFLLRLFPLYICTVKCRMSSTQRPKRKRQETKASRLSGDPEISSAIGGTYVTARIASGNFSSSEEVGHNPLQVAAPAQGNIFTKVTVVNSKHKKADNYYRQAYPKDVLRLIRDNWPTIVEHYQLTGDIAERPFRLTPRKQDPTTLKTILAWFGSLHDPPILARLHQSSDNQLLWVLKITGCLASAQVERDHKQHDPNRAGLYLISQCVEVAGSTQAPPPTIPQVLYVCMCLAT